MVEINPVKQFGEGSNDWFDREALKHNPDSARGLLANLNSKIGLIIRQSEWFRMPTSQQPESELMQRVSANRSNGIVQEMTLLRPNFRHGQNGEELNINADGRVSQLVQMRDGVREVVIDTNTANAGVASIEAISVFGKVVENTTYLGHRKKEVEAKLVMVTIDTRDEKQCRSIAVVGRDSFGEIKGYGENTYPTVDGIEYLSSQDENGKGSVDEVVVEIGGWLGNLSNEEGQLVLVRKKAPDGKWSMYSRTYVNDSRMDRGNSFHNMFDKYEDREVVSGGDLLDANGNRISFNTTSNENGDVLMSVSFLDQYDSVHSSSFGDYATTLAPVNALKVIETATQLVSNNIE